MTSSLQPLWYARAASARARLGSTPRSLPILSTRLHPPPGPGRWPTRPSSTCGPTPSASLDQAQNALAIARTPTIRSCYSARSRRVSFIVGYGYDGAAAEPYFTEAIELARALDDRWRLSQILTRLAGTAVVTGDPITARAAATEARELADAIGDGAASAGMPVLPGLGPADPRRNRRRRRRFARSGGRRRGQPRRLHAAGRDLSGLGTALAYRGEVSAARAAARKAQDAGSRHQRVLHRDGQLGVVARSIGRRRRGRGARSQ